MALKILLLRKKQQDKNKELEALRQKLADFSKREGEIAKAIEEAETDEDKKLVEEQVTEMEDQQKETKDTILQVEGELEQIVAEIEELEAAAAGEAAAEEEERGECEEDPDKKKEETRGILAGGRKRGYKTMGDFNCRSKMFNSREAMEGFYQRSEVKTFLENVRSLAGKYQRGVTGGALGIPDTVLEVLRDNVHRYSVLAGKVRKINVKGTAREQVIGDIPEAIWMEMAGALDELEFIITEIETDGFKVGGFIPIANYLLADNDIKLGEEIMFMLGQAIGKAYDKAILFGKGSGSKMPVGIFTRLAETSQPSYWGSNQGTWTDLHSSNVMALNIFSSTGASFFQTLVTSLGKAEPRFDPNGNLVWVMNRKTHIDIISRCAAFDSTGALVSMLNNTMPIIGGEIVEFDEMSDYDIGGGYMNEYLFIEREGGTVEQSKEVFFLQDKTVFKGTARCDGKPVRGEAFVIVNYNNQTPTTSKTFKNHYADSVMNVLVCTAAAGSATGDTVVTVSGSKAESPTLKYGLKIGYAIKPGDKVKSTDFASLTSGTTQITAAAGVPITVVELDGESKVVSLGTVISIPKT